MRENQPFTIQLSSPSLFFGFDSFAEKELTAPMKTSMNINISTKCLFVASSAINQYKAIANNHHIETLATSVRDFRAQ
jgi:hypothetical protein